MVRGRVSVIIPSRFERWLQPTIDDVLRHAAGDVEVLAVLDGCTQEVREDPRVRVLHTSQQIGMRDCINLGAASATGEWLLKLDGHCALSAGWDDDLKAHGDDDTVITLRRYSLDVETWTVKPDRPVVDAHYLSYPFEPGREGDVTCGLHGAIWRERAKARKDVLFDEEMSSQGSAYFLSKRYWDRLIGTLDTAAWGTFSSEFQEVGCKAWLGGGRVMILKSSHVQHLHKGSRYGTGYKYNNAEWKAWAANTKKGHDHAVRFFMLDQWKDRVHDLRWLIERFGGGGVVPTWPVDLDYAFAYARKKLAEAVPA